MQAVILAAGRGTRMRHLTRELPKSMLKIKGKPLLEHKLLTMPLKIKEVVIVVGYCGEHIIKHFKQYYAGKRIIYVFQMNKNGTGGALHLAKTVLRDKFLVMMGDDFYHPKDISQIAKHDLAIMGHEVTDSSQFGIIKTNNYGHMVDVIEKPKRTKFNLANTGLYMLNRNFFDYDLVPIGGGEFGLPQTLAKMSQKHKIKVEKARLWHPISCPGDLKKAEEVVHLFR